MALSTSSGSLDTKALKDTIDNLKETERLVDTIRDEVVDINDLFIVQTDLIREAKKAAVQHKEEFGRISTNATSILRLQRETLEINNKLGNTYIKQDSITKKIQETVTSQATTDAARIRAEAAYKKDQNSLAKAMSKLKKGKGGITQDMVDQLKAQKTESKTLVDGYKNQLKNLEAVLITLDRINLQLPIANKEIAKMEQKTKALASLFGFISKIPLIGPFLNAQLIQDAFFRSSKEGWKEVEEQGKEALKSPLVLAAMAIAAWKSVYDQIVKIVKAFLSADEAITKMGNNLAISREAAGGIYDTFRNIVETSNQLEGTLEQSFLNATNMTNALLSLQDSFETSAMFSTSMLENQILLTKQMGLSNEEAEGLQKLAYLNKTTAKDIIDISLKQNKSSLSYRKILLEISKVNSEISAAYKNNPELIAKAVVQANKLGMTLEDTRKIADSLLNFESSIDNELKAELLTGQQLNFEKARALALDGKSAEAAAELVSQMGGINSLSNLNIIQRKALAESIGLSAEELTKFAQKEEIAKRLGSENYEQLQKRYDQLMRMGEVNKANALLRDMEKQQNGQLLAQDISRASLNARFAELMVKIQEIFVDMAGPIEGLIRGIASLAKHTWALKGIFIAILAITTAIATALTVAAVASIIASGGLTALTAGAAAGGIAAIAAGAFLSSGPDTSSSKESGNVPQSVVQDSLINPNGRISISTPRGKIVPDANDSIITTTDPNGLLSGGTKSNNSGVESRLYQSGGTKSDSSGVESRLDQLISAVKTGAGINIDSRTLGTYQGMNRNSFA
jgi:hypothetical protein